MGTRTFFLRIAAIAAPFALVFASVVVVDPYNYFGWSNTVPDELKRKNLYHDGRTMPFSNLLWKLVEFRKGSHPNILLGDSRLSHFDLDHLETVSGQHYYNLGVPGGNYRTVADLFTYADSVEGLSEGYALQEVVVQVSFRGMNKGFDWDLYTEPRFLLDQPFLYLTNRRVLEATLLNLRSAVAPNSVAYDQTPPDQWQRVLAMEQENAASFSLDTTVYTLLQRMADRCEAQGARFRFVEYPTHPDVQHIYTEAGLEPLRQVYMARLAAIGTTIDLDRPGLFPEDRSYWRDPMHLTTEAQRLLIDRVWGR
ncbi:MAG: hypothetical protein KA352_09395 [Flavobacteriales bacterium]|nr:hypothetical protein [Flavobacteriales bacterium]